MFMVRMFWFVSLGQTDPYNNNTNSILNATTNANNDDNSNNSMIKGFYAATPKL